MHKVVAERIKEHVDQGDCHQCGWPLDDGDTALFVVDHGEKRNSAGDYHDGIPFCSKPCLENYYRSTCTTVIDGLCASGYIR